METKSSVQACIVSHFSKGQHRPYAEIVFLDVSIEDLKKEFKEKGYKENGLKMNRVRMVRSEYDIITIGKISCFHLTNPKKT